MSEQSQKKAGRSEQKRRLLSSFRNMLLALVCLAILVSLGGYFFLHSQQVSQQHQVEKDLQAIVDLKIKQVQEWKQDRLNDAASISQTFLNEEFATWLISSNPQTYQQIIDKLNLYRLQLLLC
jgi:type II secretory pathway pseudopilin PulG